MDYDAAHSEVNQRNVLRRAACLPMLDVEIEIGKIYWRERARIWREAMERHRDKRNSLCSAAVEEHQQRYGRGPSSGFAWMGLNRGVYEQFAAYLRSLGYEPP